MKNYIKEIRQSYTMRERKIAHLYGIAENKIQYCNSKDELFDLLGYFYTKYDSDFFLYGFAIEDMIKSLFYKSVKFFLVKKDLSANNKSKFLITPYLLFELIYQTKILGNENLFNYIKSNYQYLMKDNMFFYDEDILSFIEIDIFGEDNEFQSYLQLNNSIYANKSFLNQSIENYCDEIKDNFFLISYYLLLNNSKAFQEIFETNKIVTDQREQIVRNIQKSKENRYISRIIDMNFFFETWNH